MLLTGCIDGVRRRAGCAKLRDKGLQLAVLRGRVIHIEAAVAAEAGMKSKAKQAFFAAGSNRTRNIEIRSSQHISVLDNFYAPFLLDDEQPPRTIASLLNVEGGGKSTCHWH